MNETASRHPSLEELRLLLEAEGISDARRLELADHLADCPACSVRFAELAERGEGQPPAGFSQTVLFAIERQTRQNARAEFIRYGLRLAVSMAAAAAIFLSGAIKDIPALSAFEPRPAETARYASRLTEPRLFERFDSFVDLLGDALKCADGEKTSTHNEGRLP